MASEKLSEGVEVETRVKEDGVDELSKEKEVNKIVDGGTTEETPNETREEDLGESVNVGEKHQKLLENN